MAKKKEAKEPKEVKEIKEVKETKIPGQKRGRPAKAASVNAVFANVLKKNAPTENYFVLCNGKSVKNIKELADVMETLEEHVFCHHVRPEHNDFSAWVNDVFKDAELAEKIAGAKDSKHCQLLIYKHITHKLW